MCMMVPLLVAEQFSDLLLFYLMIPTKLHLLPKTPFLASLLGSMFKPKMSTNHFHFVKRTLSLVSIHNRCKRLFPACRQNAVFILFNAISIYFSYPFFL